MIQSPVVGTWRLASFESRTLDGNVVYPAGPDPVGYIMYNEDGYMSVAFMAADRTAFASGDIRGGSAEERIAAFDTYLSYCGTYEVQGNKVIHHIEVSLFPNWTGVSQERFFELDGDKLSLSTPPILQGGIERTSHLVWKRVGTS
jgi:hypothetical protein